MDSTTRLTEDQAGDHRAKRTTDPVSLADLISLEAVISLLVKKGLLTADELYAEESRLRAELKQKDTAPLVFVHEPQREERGSPSEHGMRRHNQSWLKRQASKHRWSRRLGTWFFGWQWKKVKRSRKKPGGNEFHVEE